MWKAHFHKWHDIKDGFQYLAPMLTLTRLSRFSLHHRSTSVANVALKRTRRTLGEEHARKMVASCSLKPVLPSSKSLSDSSTTNHSTLHTDRTCQYYKLISTYYRESIQMRKKIYTYNSHFIKSSVFMKMISLFFFTLN